MSWIYYPMKVTGNSNEKSFKPKKKKGNKIWTTTNNYYIHQLRTPSAQCEKQGIQETQLNFVAIIKGAACCFSLVWIHLIIWKQSSDLNGGMDPRTLSPELATSPVTQRQNCLTQTCVISTSKSSKSIVIVILFHLLNRWCWQTLAVQLEIPCHFCGNLDHFLLQSGDSLPIILFYQVVWRLKKLQSQI